MCPCCQATLIVDRATAAVIHHTVKEDPRKASSIGEIMSSLASQKQAAENLFSREMSSLADRERLLEEKLQEAKKRARESKELP